MKDLKKFNHTVNVLLKAYLNDTLQHGNCFACAVGNLIKDARKYTYGKSKAGRLIWMEVQTARWRHVFMTNFVSVQERDPSKYIGEAKAEIDSTGYTWQQLARIEYAFETADEGKSNDDWMFNGLMAVVDVLAKIHEIDLETVKETKELFV